MGRYSAAPSTMRFPNHRREKGRKTIEQAFVLTGIFLRKGLMDQDQLSVRANTTEKDVGRQAKRVLRGAKQTDMGDISLYGNRRLIRIGGRGQGCAHSMSKPDFQIPHRDLPRLGGIKSTGCFDFGNAVADLFCGGGKRFSSLPSASRRCCCAHPWPRPSDGGAC
jgi:hypothetical protein